MHRDRRRTTTSCAARVAGMVRKKQIIAGREFWLTQPRMVGIYADIESFIISRKTNP